MEIAERLDGYGKAAWITVMILGFVVFWPIGLGILAYMIGSGRMGCWKFRGPGRWHFNALGEGRSASHRRRRREPPATGNHAFDEYREETLHRLEDEQREFEDFLDNLRQAKDKAEFDQFMAGQGNRAPEAGEAPDSPDQPAG